MMRRIAVVGDTLERGGEILPYSGPVCSWEGHQAARISGEAFCAECETTGVISKTGGPSRLTFEMGEVALDGDIVLCGCVTPPRIKAKLSGESWCTDEAEHYAAIAHQAALLAAGSNDASRHDEQFTLRDANWRAVRRYLLHDPFSIRLSRAWCNGRPGSHYALQNRWSAKH